MNDKQMHYRIAYFFTVVNMANPEPYLKMLQQGLRTIDPDAPDSVQPELEGGAVAFLESVNSEQLKLLEEQLKQVFASTFMLHRSYLDTLGVTGEIGMTVYIKDDNDKTAVLFAQSQPDPDPRVAFGYQVNITPGTTLTEDSTTQVGSGKDAVHAILAFFGELESATGNSLQ